LDARQVLADTREALREVTGKNYEQINMLDEKRRWIRSSPPTRRPG